MDEKDSNQVQSDNLQTPGAVISPGTVSQPVQGPAMENNAESSGQPADAVVSGNLQSAGQPVQPAGAQLTKSDGELSWIGPEFISHEKSSNWYMTCLAVAIVLGAATYFATGRDIVSSMSIAVAVAVLGFYTLRKPKDITYTLSDRGITIGQKNFAYEQLRTFTATLEGEYLSITIIPLKRFAPPMGLCYRGDEEDSIVNFLSDRLPLEKHKPDLLERLLIRIRF